MYFSRRFFFGITGTVKCSMMSSVVRTRFSGQDLLIVFVFNVIQIRVLRGSPELKEPSPVKTRNQRKRKVEDTASGNEQNIHDDHVSLINPSR